MAYQNILVERLEGKVGLVRLNRPKALNALNPELMAELMDALEANDRDETIGCHVITGNEKAFAAGADIKEMAEATAVDMFNRDNIRHWDRLSKLHKPVIAAVSGWCLGGGCEIAMACDMIVASETARFGQPEITIGVIPGVGEDVASWVSYDLAKRASKRPEEFGKGSREGLMAAETGDNACIGGAIIPVLALAVPGSAPAAVLLGAMWLHGVRPGPLLMIEFPNYVWEISAMLILAACASLLISLVAVRFQVRILSIPRPVLMPIVFALCVIGSYAINVRLFDLWVMFAFGLIGYAMRQNNYPAAPMVLGVILGDMLDVSLRRALIRTEGDLAPFFTRPICLVLLTLTLVVVGSRIPLVRRGIAGLTGRRATRERSHRTS